MGLGLGLRVGGLGLGLGLGEQLAQAHSVATLAAWLGDPMTIRVLKVAAWRGKSSTKRLQVGSVSLH